MKKLLMLTLLCLPLATLAAEPAASEKQTYRMSRSLDHGTLDRVQLESRLDMTEFNVQPPLSNTTRTTTRALASAANSGPYWLYVYDTEVNVDWDNDGYYQQFTLSFEPEVVSGHERVYADIYLSYEGHTWDFLTTTSVHTLSAGSPGNVINVTTALDYGFPSGHYDVLIELRDAYTDRLLVSAGPDTEGGLSYLPLEDSDHDYRHFDYGIGVDYYAYGSGSLGLGGLALAGGLMGFRRLGRRQTV